MSDCRTRRRLHVEGYHVLSPGVRQSSTSSYKNAQYFPKPSGIHRERAFPPVSMAKLLSCKVLCISIAYRFTVYDFGRERVSINTLHDYYPVQQVNISLLCFACSFLVMTLSAMEGVTES
jgi:hypothetical protein